MRKLEARLIVPSFSSDRLLGFLVLGGKQSGEPYSTDDVALFSALANQAGLAIENALFFEELRNNEAYMIQSEKLASLGQLASGMAHEIHNPLTIISGESQLFLERFKGQDEKVDKLLTSIVEECRRAADITRRILRFAKPAPTDFVPVNLKAVIGETLTLAGYQVRMDRFECAVTIADKLPEVRGNQNQLQEVLLNLVLNACQAMGEKGGKLMVTATTQDSQVVLTVEDNGPGIPAAILRKVFDPFYTTKATGTGLGLFVTQRIVKAHGGTIQLESTEGKGTCFTITLPACGKDATVSGSAV
jgi:signal transduction histidine kinase